jgi:hypothetical protein
MTDAQLISLVSALGVTPLAALTVVLIGRAWERGYVDVQVKRLQEKIEAQTSRLQLKMDHMETSLLGRMADLDNRLQRLEAK